MISIKKIIKEQEDDSRWSAIDQKLNQLMKDKGDVSFFIGQLIGAIKLNKKIDINELEKIIDVTLKIKPF
jgi:hypothetical protein